jgi:hypothetical protein
MPFCIPNSVATGVKKNGQMFAQFARAITLRKGTMILGDGSDPRGHRGCHGSLQFTV